MPKTFQDPIGHFGMFEVLIEEITLGNNIKQAGAELGQAQVKLEVVDEGLAKA